MTNIKKKNRRNKLINKISVNKFILRFDCKKIKCNYYI